MRRCGQDRPGRRRRVALLAAVCVAVAATGAGGLPATAPPTTDGLAAIRARGTLRVAVLAEYPWLVEAGRGRFHGPAWTLIEAVARRLGVRVEPVPVGFDDKLAAVLRGDADVSAAPMLVTPARARVAAFIPYSTSAQCLFGRGDDPAFARARTIDDLNRPDVTLAAIAGTLPATWLARRLPRAKQIEVPGSAADIPVDHILSGRADAAPVDKYFVKALLRRDPVLLTLPRCLACLSSREMATPVGIAVAPGQSSLYRLVRTVATAALPAIRREQTAILASAL